MDIPAVNLQQRSVESKGLCYSLAAVVAVALITVGVSRLKPAAPSVDPATLWKGTDGDPRLDAFAMFAD